MKKKKLIYNIITSITLGLPIVVYLFISATIFKVEPDYRLFNFPIEEVNEYITENFIIFSDGVSVEGNIELIEENGKLGFYVEEEEILLINNKHLYQYKQGKLEEVEKKLFKKEERWKIPTAFFISLAAVGIVLLIYKRVIKIPELNVLIALATGTAILALMNMIISNMLHVFIIALSSWTAYCIEKVIYTSSLKTDKVEEDKTSLRNLLLEALNNEE